MNQPDVLIAGRYRLLNRVGVGGMGSVWEARDERLQRTVAAKLLHLPPGASAADAENAKNRAMREARNTARLHHAHAVPVFDVVEHEGQPCLIMQYLPSRTLQQVLDENGPLPPDDVALIGAEVGSALAAAHAAGIVHRDVKPANVLILDDGSAMITDFGISRALGDATLTAAGMVTGTPAYLAPEVARGEESTPATDVFSLGATLYAAVEGTPPFGLDPNPMALLHRVASSSATPPTRAGALTPVLLAMLGDRPSERPFMAAAVEALERVDLTGPAGADPTVAMPAAADPTVAMPVAGATQPLRTVPPALPRPGARVAAAGAAVGAGAGASSASGGVTSPRPAADRARVTGTGDPGGSGRRRSRRGVLVALAVVALVAVGLLAWQALTAGDGRTPSAAPPETTSASSPSTTPSPRTTTSPRPTTTSAAPTTQSETPPSAPAAPSAAKLSKAVREYYSLLPDDTEEGYALLTERYRSTTAGSVDTYESFWDSIKKVTVKDVDGSPPGTVEATLTYVFKDGRVFVERTAYGLVEEDGVLKIDSSEVLSSREV